MNKNTFSAISWLLLLLSSVIAQGQAPRTKPKFPVEVTLSTANRWDTYLREELLDPPRPLRVLLSVKVADTATQTLEYAIEVKDFFGKVVHRSRRKQVNLSGKVVLEETFQPKSQGAFDIIAHLRCADQTQDKSLTAILVPSPHPGLRPDSFFASNTEAKGHPDFHQKIGLKVYRQHFADAWKCLSPALRDQPRQPSDPLPFDFTALDDYLAECRRHDISLLGIVGYVPPAQRAPEAQRLKMYGPPRDLDEFLRATIPVVARYKEIKYWEFWNEPWIYGWTWAASAAEYRRFQIAWIQAAKKVRPDITVLAANSASFFADNLAPYPEAVRGLVDADSNHPYKEGNQPSLRRGSQVRYMDYGVQTAERMGIHRHFITENGTEAGGKGKDSPLNASKIVAMHVQAALTGLYQMNIQEDIGWSLSQKKGAAAYAVMTHFLEDRVPVADLWPRHPLLWGAVFANPKFADPTLPRAREFNARWGVPGRADDNTKVAVLWSYTGETENALDANGTLTLRSATDVQAFDIMGNPTGRRNGDRLTVPFTPSPVYLTSTTLSVKELYERLRDAEVKRITPIALSLFSLTQPVETKPAITVRLQNQMNRTLTARLRLTLPAGWSVAEKEQRVTLQPAELGEVSFRLKSGVPNAANLYPITVQARTEYGQASRTQTVQVACAPQKTVEVDGRLDDWDGVLSVTMDSDWLAIEENWTYLALNPNQPRPAPLAQKPRVQTKTAACWDKENLYLAFAVTEPLLKQDAGKPYRDTRYITGQTDGIRFPLYTGDAIVFAFGVNERAEDDYRTPDDPWYWKGCFRDSDYQYVAFSSESGAQLLRLHKPGLLYRTGFQSETPEGQGNVPGGKIALQRVSDTTYYEISLPRSEMPTLTPETLSQTRFGFIVGNNEGVGSGGRLQWSQVAGVFDYWYNNASFQPSWESFWANQARWGFSSAAPSRQTPSTLVQREKIP